MNNELSSANKELQKMYHLKNELITIISHDLRSPFTAIKGYADLLYDNENDGQKKHYLSVIRTNALNQLEYVDEILSMLRTGNSDLKLKYQKIFASELINRSVKSLEILAKKKSIILKVELSNDAKIEIDISKIYQVLNNLLSNAIKFTGENGEIILKGNIADENFELHVIDNGIGYTDTEDIFQPFISTNSGTSGETGSGLGLSIARMYVNAHGGSIKAKKRENGGSDFFFIIPTKKTDKDIDETFISQF